MHNYTKIRLQVIEVLRCPFYMTQKLIKVHYDMYL